MRCKTTATCAATAALLATVLVRASARADENARPEIAPARIDVVGDTQSRSAVVVLQGQDKANPWVSAEALFWGGGSTNQGAIGDAVVLAVRLHDPNGLGEVRFGRFVYTTGAIRPMHIDGVSALVRAPWGTSAEAVAGLPVVVEFGPRPYDWVAGGRIAQSIASQVTIGASYVQRREQGDVSDEEAGADFAALLAPWLDFAGRAAYDLVSPGVTDALASVAARTGDFRFETFANDRSPSRMLPQTSLFSVLGDFRSQSLGESVRWKAAPRLDLWVTGAAQSASGSYGGNARARALLRLDELGAGSIGAELWRQDVSTARWTGVRVTITKPLSRKLRFGSELEIVVPDAPDGRGSAWPWGLMSLAWRPETRWEIAIAGQSASTPAHIFEANALARFTVFLGAK